MRISDWSSDVCSSDLIVALKMRFLHLMEPAERRVQAELLHEICERELARLIDLRAYHGEEPGPLCAWLDSEIAPTRARPDWFAGLRAGLARGQKPPPRHPPPQTAATRSPTVTGDRKPVVSGKREPVRVNIGGSRVCT